MTETVFRFAFVRVVRISTYLKTTSYKQLQLVITTNRNSKTLWGIYEHYFIDWLTLSLWQDDTISPSSWRDRRNCDQAHSQQGTENQRTSVAADRHPTGVHEHQPRRLHRICQVSLPCSTKFSLMFVYISFSCFCLQTNIWLKATSVFNIQYQCFVKLRYSAFKHIYEYNHENFIGFAKLAFTVSQNSHELLFKQEIGFYILFLVQHKAQGIKQYPA